MKLPDIEDIRSRNKLGTAIPLDKFCVIQGIQDIHDLLAIVEDLQKANHELEENLIIAKAFIEEQSEYIAYVLKAIDEIAEAIAPKVKEEK